MRDSLTRGSVTCTVNLDFGIVTNVWGLHLTLCEFLGTTRIPNAAGLSPEMLDDRFMLIEHVLDQKDI